MRGPVLALTITSVLLVGGDGAAPAQETKPGPAAPAAQMPATAGSSWALQVPAGFSAAAGTAAEPYTQTAWAREIVHEPTGLVFRYVPAGEFLMGSPADEPDRLDNEVPHRVTLTQGFYLGKYEVTQGQWAKVMGNNPSHFQHAGAAAPVEMISWQDCQEFIKQLNAALPPRRPEPGAPRPAVFRLPTEAEWEYACRAGTRGPFCTGDRLTASQANFYRDGAGPDQAKTLPVGSFQPNAWGLFDVHGNVWEWCLDWRGDYPTGAQTDPTGPPTGWLRVIRGGSWYSGASGCRAALRYGYGPGDRYRDVGCRLACALAPGP